MQINRPVELLGARRNSLGPKQLRYSHKNCIGVSRASETPRPPSALLGRHGGVLRPETQELHPSKVERTTASFCNYLHRYVHVSAHYFIFMFERGNKSSIKLMKS